MFLSATVKHAQINIDPITWEACKAGDRQAYASIYTAYYTRLYNYGHKFTCDTSLVEDSIQEIFALFWIHRQKLEMVKELRSYLFVSFRNYLIKVLQQHRLIQSGTDIDDTTYAFALDLSAEQRRINAEEVFAQQEQLQKGLQLLTPRQKEAVFLRFYENMPYEEIADMLQISVKATYKLIARAIAELRATCRQPLAAALTLSALAALLGSMELAILLSR